MNWKIIIITVENTVHAGYFKTFTELYEFVKEREIPTDKVIRSTVWKLGDEGWEMDYTYHR